MASSEPEVVIIGGGAAGIAAARRLTAAAIKCRVLEARSRLGGRAWTVTDPAGGALDLGCGWLHSADRNPWTRVAGELGRAIDRRAPPWQKPALQNGFPRANQQEFREAQHAFFERLEGAAKREPDVASDAFLEPGNRWNPLIDAVATYITGAELKYVSAHDFDNYADDEINWRLPDGLGACIAAYGEGLTVALECPVRRIDHSGRRLKIDTAKGVVTADQVVVALPSSSLADESLFAPALLQKAEAARGLPLGLNDKLFLSLDRVAEFEPDSRLFGHTDRTATASYAIRPLGRPTIEVYFGGSYAAALEAEGEAAFFAAARDDLVRLFGGKFAARLRPLQMHRWGADPFARGSYSYALPGKAGCRAILAAPVDDRLFFAGEACSINDFSTAHGAFRTGVAAAEQVIAARQKP